MGRGFGRGAKSVAIVTHAQVKKQKKLPKGLRGSRKQRRRTFAATNDDQAQLEKSMGVRSADGRTSTAGAVENMKRASKGPQLQRTMAQEIASIQFPTAINKRQKGFKQLRRDILASVKEIRKRHHQKATKRNKNRISSKQYLAQQYVQEVDKKMNKRSGNARRMAEDEEGSSSSGEGEEDLE
eukprot:Tbor_TRINITY_DN3163_c0_g1::TRINITY_DN3163_c0_g1_i1::g.14788::m.14788